METLLLLLGARGKIFMLSKWLKRGTRYAVDSLPWCCRYIYVCFLIHCIQECGTWKDVSSVLVGDFAGIGHEQLLLIFSKLEFVHIAFIYSTNKYTPICLLPS